MNYLKINILFQSVKHFVRVLPTCALFLLPDQSWGRTVDVLIIGGGASGVAAGVQASRMGAKVLVAEETPWLGGMLTSAGVSAIDGNFRMPAGFFGEFRNGLVEYYGHIDSLHTGWVSMILFEPSAGDKVLKKLASKESNLSIEYNTRLQSVERKKKDWVAVIKKASGKTEKVKARVLIDGTELGDVAKLVGVPYDMGMESRSVTGEDIAPLHGNDIIQDLTMVATLKEYDHDVTIERPEDYDPDEFACTARNPRCVSPKEPARMRDPQEMITYGKLPNGKYMINWPIEGNDYYVNLVEMTREQRDSAIAEAKAHTLRYVYFLQNELGFRNLGLADDEYPTADHLPMIPYHRESRRIHGKVRFDLNHMCKPYTPGRELYRTGIAVGDYPVDHHHQAYCGVDSLPNLFFRSVPSYNLPMGTLLPAATENFIVTEKSISVSNIVNGSTRLQPVVVQIGQAAGAIAALAALNNINVGDVAVRDVQTVILNAGGYLMPFLDVAKNDPRFKAYQRVGATGILRGVGRSVNWKNETWLRANEPLKIGELTDFTNFYSLPTLSGNEDAVVTVSTVEPLLAAAKGGAVDAVKALAALGVDKTSSDVITRGEFAILVDAILHPFESRGVNIEGQFIN